MSRRTPRRSVGIDIGATAVRVVEVNGLDADSVAQITKCAIVPLAPGAVVAGKIQDIPAVAWAVAAAVKEAKVSRYGAVMGISSSDTYVAPVVLPAALKANEWTLALRTTGRELSPKVPMANAALSLYPLPFSDFDNPNQRTLLAAAALEDEVAKVVAVAKRAKVTLRAVDLSAAATTRALTRSVPGSEDVATVVDIGSSKVTVATRQGLSLRSVRTFEGGGERVTRSVMGALGGSYDAAEDAKLAMRLGPSVAGPATVEDYGIPAPQALYGALPQATSTLAPGGTPAQDALTTAADKLIDEIAAAIESDTATHPNRPTQGMLLVGGTALLRGLKARIVQRVGAPASIARPWARVVPSKNTESALVDGVEDPVILLSLATAVGLAIWKDMR